MDAPKKSNGELYRLIEGRPPHGPWKHYKGGLYWVDGVVILESTLEPLVIYRPHQGPITFARPLSEWDELVEVNGQKVPRFSHRPDAFKDR